MVSKTHMKHGISYTFPGDLELLISSTSISKERWRRKAFLSYL